MVATSLVWAIVAVVASSANAPEGAGRGTGQVARSAPGADDYAGQDTCLTCHEDHSYKGTLHAFAANRRTPAATHGCESCHGPGKKHAESGGDTSLIVNPAKLKPQKASELCVTCHNRASSGTLNPQRALHALWAGSQHDQRSVGCVSCHSIHAAKGPAQIKAANELQLCSTCHRAIVNKQLRLNHMPVREGAMSCSSCHNPHGSTNVRMLKAGTTVDESCQTCHADKRGPYLWEHAPVSESCVTCHDPHGSNNDRMLVSRMPFLCQRCHVTSRHPPTVYEGFLLNNSSNGNKIFGRSCLVCHQAIHGSNAPSGKALLR